MNITVSFVEDTELKFSFSMSAAREFATRESAGAIRCSLSDGGTGDDDMGKYKIVK